MTVDEAVPASTVDALRGLGPSVTLRDRGVDVGAGDAAPVGAPVPYDLSAYRCPIGSSDTGTVPHRPRGANSVTSMTLSFMVRVLPI